MSRATLFSAPIRVALVLLVLVATGPVTSALAQPPSVDSATPSSTAQGTVSLDVTIAGKNFKTGAATRFYVTGTTNPGGVVVNSTSWVSSTQVKANITVAADAVLANYDIEIANVDGRTGKGTEKFSVYAPNGAAAACGVSGAPAGFALVERLNSADASGTPAFGPALGTLMLMTRLQNPDLPTLDGHLLLAVGSRPNDTAQIELFVIHSSTGKRIDGVPPVDPLQPTQPHITLFPPVRSSGGRVAAWGDFDGNGVPDLAVSSGNDANAFAFFGHVAADGTLRYDAGVEVPKPAGRTAFGSSVAAGDLDGDTVDDLVVTSTGAGSGKSAELPRVWVYKRVSGSWVRLEIAPSLKPAAAPGDYYGVSVAVGDVDGDNDADIVVGASGRAFGTITGAGAAFVHKGPFTIAASSVVLAPEISLTAAAPAKSEAWGSRVGTGHVDSVTGVVDIVVLTTWGAASIRADVFTGPVASAARPATAFVMTPDPGLGGGWGTARHVTTGNFSSGTGVLIGAPNASANNVCNSPGAAYAFVGPTTQGGAGMTRYRLEAPGPEPDPDFAGYGWGVAAEDGSNVIAVSEHGRNVGTVAGAGQVYLYIVSK